MDMRKYSIYIIRNMANEKVYIGQTSQSVSERFNQHKKPSTSKLRGSYKIYNAMKKYGRENFYVEELESGISEEEIDQKEIEYIQKYDSFRNGYNSTPGGDGRTICKVEDEKLFIELYNSGLHEKDIAKLFNISKETVRRTAKYLSLPGRVGRVTKEYLLKNMNKTNKEMARELSVDEETITRAFKKYGIKRGKGCNNTINPQNRAKVTDDRKEEFEKLWRNRNISIEEMAKHFAINKRQLFRYAKRFNLPKRRNIQRGD